MNQDHITAKGYVRRFAVKTTLAGGIVYYSIQQGLWSKSEDSVQLYGKVYNNVTPYIKDNIPKEVLSEVGLISTTKFIIFSTSNAKIKRCVLLFSSRIQGYLKDINETISDCLYQQYLYT